MDISGTDIYIAGNFTGTDKSKGRYTNIVKYDTNANQLKALQGQGFDGIVHSLVCADTGKNGIHVIIDQCDFWKVERNVH